MPAPSDGGSPPTRSPRSAASPSSASAASSTASGSTAEGTAARAPPLTRHVGQPPRRLLGEQRRRIPVVAPQCDQAVADLEHGGDAERGALTRRMEPHLGALDHDRIALLEQLVNGRRKPFERRQAELELGGTEVPD